MPIPIWIASVITVLPTLLKKNEYNLWVWEPNIKQWYKEQTGKARTLKKYAKTDLVPNKVIYRILAKSIIPVRPPKGA
jgi:hypothetical protein